MGKTVDTQPNAVANKEQSPTRWMNSPKVAQVRISLSIMVAQDAGSFKSNHQAEDVREIQKQQNVTVDIPECCVCCDYGHQMGDSIKSANYLISQLPTLDRSEPALKSKHN